jgi:hypothetical protein
MAAYVLPGVGGLRDPVARRQRVASILGSTKDPVEVVKKLRAEGFNNEADRLEGSRGMLSTAVGTATGLPDIAITGYNLFQEPQGQVKTLRERTLEALNVPTKASTPEGEFAYNAPEVAAALWGISGLVKSGWNVGKNFFENKKIKKILDTVDEADLGAFKKYALTGQGGESREVQRVIDRLSQSDKYGEMIAKLRSGATEAAVKGMTPTASKLSNEKAAAESVRAITDRINGLKEATNKAGTGYFNQAFGLGEGKPLVSTDNVLDAIRSLKSDFNKGNTDSSRRAVAFLDELEGNLVPTGRTAAYAGTSVVRKGTPDITYGAVPGRTVTETIQGGPGNLTSFTVPGTSAGTRMETKTVYDSLGMPREVQVPVQTPATSAITGVTPTVEYDALGNIIPRTTTRSYNVPGSSGTVVKGIPDVTINIPGSPGFGFSYGQRKLTLEEVQSMLKSFGAEAASSQGLIKDVSLTDQQRIAKAIFGSLKDDMRASATALNAAGDLKGQKAVELMNKGRQAVSGAYEKYNSAMSEALPSWAKGKDLNTTPFSDLVSNYTAAQPSERAAFRLMMKDTNEEALKALDSHVWDNFVSSNRVQRPDGTYGVDIQALAESWFNLGKTPEGKNMREVISSSLGANSGEFDSRMSDALKFVRSFASKAAPDSTALDTVTREIPAVVGATAGYSPSKAVAVGLDTAKAALKKSTLDNMSEDLLMKVLLSPEGKEFLKTADLSKNATQTLMNLDKVRTTSFVPSVTMIAPMITSPKGAVQGEQLQQGAEEDLILPDSVIAAQKSAQISSQTPQQEEELVLPDSVLNAMKQSTQGLQVTQQSPEGSTIQANTPEADVYMQQMIQQNPGVSLNDLIGRLNLRTQQP